MNTSLALRAIAGAFILLAFLTSEGLSQGYGNPLTMQGVNHFVMQSAASRAAGGTIFGLQNDASTMFSNPAGLTSLRSPQLSLGGLQQKSNVQQIQNYAPLKYYSNFSLLMEGLTGYIPDPDTTRPSGTPGDTVYRPYDDIGPNWSRSKSNTLPIQAMAAIPFEMGGMSWGAGTGYIEYSDLRYYYQNNNVLTPAILAQRPSAIPLPTNILPLETQWTQYLQSRDGSIRGYGIALAGLVSEEIAIGVSGMLLRGSSDDYEQQTGRGKLTFFANYFRLEPVALHAMASGRSEFSGEEFTVSGMYLGEQVTFGFALKPPSSITRKFNSTVRIDSTGTVTEFVRNGEDKVKLPVRGTAGLSVKVRDDVRFSLEYELRPYASAKYIDAAGNESKPWLSSSLLRTGIAYDPTSWLQVRAGIRGHTEVFEPEGNPIDGEVVGGSVYSGGIGLVFAGTRLNLTYEYSNIKYQDIWGANVNFNSDKRHAFVADIVYELPW